eukprot:9559087-Karenia_brevis.AAC.1
MGPMSYVVHSCRPGSIYHLLPPSLPPEPGIAYRQQVWKDGVPKSEPCKWTIDGVNKPGVYPIFVRKSTWFLDQHRKVPKLKIDRSQLPLAPAFSITAHSAQGRTMDAAIIDLKIGRGVDSRASYVAMTRVRRRTDLLIYRPFEREIFTRGPPEGP